ncbi:MAG: 3,4-dihydroxy-2-butanone-4-phosphate synthase [Victivallales bacterium]|nr:3,4-dihydroxy-2-butanone-4-phosphate synthase [Victivallales bacterium]
MFNTTEELIGEINKGNMIILLDDESRENEGDLIFAAKFADAEKINFMIKNAGGLICVPSEQKVLEKLSLNQMTEDNTESHSTAFTVSVDAAEGITSGISASDRAATAKLLSEKSSAAEDFVKPGHMFPLCAKDNGVFERQGHTEAAVDFVKLAGIDPAVGVICEIIKDDGEMARRDDLLKFAEKYSLKIGTIKDLVEYRKRNEKKLELEAETVLPIKNLGEWGIKIYRNIYDGRENIVLVKGSDFTDKTALVRIHSECFTGDVLGSDKCDCSDQLHRSLEAVNNAGAGAVIYLRQEGRGIGLINKIKAYQLQNNGYDTAEANLKLGFGEDLREYSEAAEILKKLNIKRVRLITNNKDKIDGLIYNGIEVVGQVILPAKITKGNKKYLDTKKEKFGHSIIEYNLDNEYTKIKER